MQEHEKLEILSGIEQMQERAQNILTLQTIHREENQKLQEFVEKQMKKAKVKARIRPNAVCH